MRQRLTVEEKLDELLRTDPISALRQVSGGVLCELLLRDGLRPDMAEVAGHEASGSPPTSSHPFRST